MGVDDGVELADLIWQLRYELSRAMWAGEHTDLRFEAGPVELELTVVVEKSTAPGVKARLLVVDAEVGGRRASTVTQRIRLSLHPRRADAADVSPLIGGRVEEGER
jgi:Trypsin-co-occurring domain 2